MAIYKKYATKNGTPIQVQSAIEDGAGHNIENTYAKQNGYYQGLTAGLADNLTPYSPDSGSEQSNPFNMEATGCGNGETHVDTGSYCQVKEKRGNGIVYNQLANPETSQNDIDAGVSVVKNNDGTQTINGTATANTVVKLNTVSFKAGHKYFISGCKNLADVSLYIISPISGNIVPLSGGIVTISANTSTTVRLQVNSGVTVTNEKINLIVIDLTKWFNGNIPTYLLSHPEAFYRYYQGDLSYNEGEVKFSNSRYLYSIDRQQWDEEWEVGDLATGSGQPIASANYIRSKNYTEIIPNTTYYGYKSSGVLWAFYYDPAKNFIGYTVGGFASTFTTPSNCKYIKITHNVSTYNNDITISLYYEGETGYNQYYPYRLLQQTDTGTEQLYAAGEAYDYKLPSGLITRNVGSVGFGENDNWQYTSGNEFFYITLEDAKLQPDSTTPAQITCGLYETRIYADVANINADDMGIAIGNELYGGYPRLAIKNKAYSDVSTFKSAMTNAGVVIYYELATPTTEQGTPYAEKLDISDFGSLRYEGTNGVPQGNLIFYPVDYKAYEDTLVNYTDGDVHNIALKSEINNLLGDKQTKLTQSTDLTPTTQTLTLTANTRYAFGTLTALNITFPASGNDGDEIIIEFISGNTATTLTRDTTNAIYNFSSVGTDVFVEFNAQYKASISKWVVYSAETAYTAPQE